MTLARLLPLLLVALTALSAPAGAAGDALPPHRVLFEDLSEQRRQVSVRIERRLKEAELTRIGEAIRARQSRPFARTIVNFFLPGQDLQQGSWASVAYTTDLKVTVNGLRLEDEEVLIAEHNADTRHLLGSWLTSPPAALGRLTIFSDDGKIFGEWRLRNGQRTVDELVDVSRRSERRFDVPGGSTYVLTRSGDLEIREKTALVAVAERIRPRYLVPPASVALGQSAATAAAAARPAAAPSRMPKSAVAAVASPVQPEPAAVVPSDATVPAGPRFALPSATEPTEVQGPQAAAKAKSKGHATARAKEARTRPGKVNGDNTPGDQIAAKLGRL